MSFSLGGIIKGIGSIATNVIKGSPIGSIITTAAGILKPKAPTKPTVLGDLPTIFTGARPTALPPVSITPTSVAKVPMPTLPQLSGGGVVKSGPFGDVSGGSSSTAPGQYQTTRGHWKKDGQWSNRRRPRMNPMNVRAARKAVTRINAAEKLFRRILRVASPEKASRRITPRKR